MEEIKDEQLTNVNPDDVQIAMPILGNQVEDAESEPEEVSTEQVNAEQAETVQTKNAQDIPDTEENANLDNETMQDVTEENADQDISNENADEPEKHEADEAIQNVLETLASLDQKVDDLGRKFDARIMHTDSEEKVIDRMHDELIKYKGDMYSQLLRPILLDLIDMRDSINRMADVYSSKPEGEQAVPLSSFTTYSDDLEEILTKNNINIYRSKEGEQLVPLKQRPVKKVPTPVKELNGKVAEIASDGYEYLGKVISPEKVAVYVYQEPEKKEGEE